MSPMVRPGIFRSLEGETERFLTFRPTYVIVFWHGSRGSGCNWDYKEVDSIVKMIKIFLYKNCFYFLCVDFTILYVRSYKYMEFKHKK